MDPPNPSHGVVSGPYSDYQSVLELLKKDDTNVYQDIMKKEKQSLDTMNNAIKAFNDAEYAKKQFVHMSYVETVLKFADTLSDIIKDIQKTKNINEIGVIFLKGDRLIFIGLFLVIMSVFIFFVI